MGRRIVLPGLLFLIGCTAQGDLAPPTPEERPTCSDGRCLSLLSWNVHGLPWPISSDPCGRLDRIVSAIRAAAPDVVALQEVWLARYQRRLERALAADYTAILQARRALIAGPAGGLMVFVRRAGTVRPGSAAPHFVPYQHKAKGHLLEGDSISGKGVLHINLEAEGRTICLLNTHLQAQYPESGPDHLYIEERKGQLRELRTVAETCGDRLTLIAGDFNTAPGEHGVYDTLITPLGRDLTVPAQSECGNGCGTHFRADGTKTEWIDYVISPTSGITATVERISNIAVDRPFSDHDGVLARIAFEDHAKPGVR